jgi:hypothetical protein
VRQKVLLVNFACSHSAIIERDHVASDVKGTVAWCDKCRRDRTIKEKSWVDPKKAAE